MPPRRRVPMAAAGATAARWDEVEVLMSAEESVELGVDRLLGLGNV
jgi:hypothetical protein